MASFTISQLPEKQVDYTFANSDLIIMSIGTSTPFVSTAKITLNELESYFESVSGVNSINGLKGYSAWTTLNANSSEYESTFSLVGGNSGKWDNAAVNVWTLSADIAEVAALSGGWNSVHTHVTTTSGNYLSGQNTSLSAFPASSSIYRWRHGDEFAPGFVRAVAACISAESGYSVGDEVDLMTVRSNYGVTGPYYPAAILATSSVYISAIFAQGNDSGANTHSGYILPHASDGSPDATLTPNKWQVQVFTGNPPV